MIIEFSGTLDPGVYDIFHFVPSKAIPLAVWFVSCLFLLFGLFDFKAKFALIRSRMVVWGCSLLALGGSFFASYGISDEVAVNLEHAYNLYHHGLFSMSPREIVDGTVEIPFYLLHTPFGTSAHSLVLANFLICLSVFVAFTALVSGSAALTANPIVSVLIVSSWVPLVNVFSSGFGNGFPALFFVLGVLCIISRKLVPLLLIVFILPFIRPDALLTCGVLLLVYFVDRWIARERKWGFLALGSLVSLAGFAGYAFLFTWYYGDTTPTPVRFKSITPGMLEYFSIKEFLAQLYATFEAAPRAIAIFTFLGLLGYLAFTRNLAICLSPSHRVLRILGCSVLFSTPIFFFFVSSNSVVPDFSGTTERYWIVWDISLLLFFIKSTSHVLLNLGGLLPEQRVRMDYAMAPALVLLALGTLIGGTWFDNRGRLGIAGGVVEDHFPASLSLSTAEMNIFGLMIDDPVQDYWGYSNDVIAASDICNGGVNRISPELFLEERDDVFYMHFIGQREKLGVDAFFEIEQVMAVSQNNFARNSGYRLGDMTEVMEQYDVVVVRIPDNSMGFLVRKDKVEVLSAHLKDQGFELSRQRPFDDQSFASSYFANPLRLRDCG